MIKNSKVGIKNLASLTIFYKALSHLLLKFEQIETLRNMQQNLLLTGKSYKMGNTGYFHFNNVASNTHPIISEYFAIACFSSAIYQHRVQLNF